MYALFTQTIDNVSILCTYVGFSQNQPGPSPIVFKYNLLEHPFIITILQNIFKRNLIWTQYEIIDLSKSIFSEIMCKCFTKTNNNNNNNNVTRFKKYQILTR